MKIETLAIHAAAEPDPVTGAIAPPIYLSTTFEHGPACEELHTYNAENIKQAQEIGLSLKEIKELLATGGGADKCRRVSGLLRAKLEEIDRRIKTIRSFLADAGSSPRRGASDVSARLRQR